MPVDEEHSTDVLSEYGLSKLTMEKYLRLSGLNHIIFRFSNVYGEKQTVNGEAGVIAKFNEAMKNNEPVYIDGDGEQTRDFIYVKDIARICYFTIKENISNETINISTNKGLSIKDLFNILSKKHNYNKKAIYRPKRIGDIEISILDNQKLLKFTKNFNFTDIEVGLENLISNTNKTPLP